MDNERKEQDAGNIELRNPSNGLREPSRSNKLRKRWSQIIDNELRVTEEKSPESILEKVMNYIQEGIFSTIPSEMFQAMKPSYFNIFAICIWIVMAGVFLALFLPGYYQIIDQRYLAPIDDYNSDLCDEIAVSNTGKYMFTREGYWENNKAFEYSKALYTLVGVDILYTKAAYEKAINGVINVINDVASEYRKADLGKNLLLLMTGSVSGNVASQRFYFNADPSMIFQREHMSTGFSTIYGDCPATFTHFNSENANLEIQFANFQRTGDLDYDSNCTIAVDPTNFGYDPRTNSNHFTVKIDLRTLVTAVSLNENIMDFNVLTEIPDSIKQVAINGTLYEFRNYYDARYAGMRPVSCMTAPIAVGCFIFIGKTMTLPVFNHIGASFDFPAPCDCESLTAEDLSDRFHPCNLFVWMTSLVFFNTEDPIDVLYLASKFRFSEPKISFNSAIFYTQFFTTNPIVKNVSERVDIFSAVQSFTGKYPTILSTSYWDSAVFHWSVNDYFVQIQNGACREVVSLDDQARKRLINESYASLTQDYVVCRYSELDAVVNTFGITVGNFQVLSPFIVLFFVAAVILFQQCTGFRFPHKQYSGEKSELLDDLATSLLLIRKGKEQKIPAMATGEVRLLFYLQRDLWKFKQQYDESYDANEDGKVVVQNGVYHADDDFLEELAREDLPAIALEDASDWMLQEKLSQQQQQI